MGAKGKKYLLLKKCIMKLYNIKNIEKDDNKFCHQCQAIHPHKFMGKSDKGIKIKCLKCGFTSTNERMENFIWSKTI